MSDDELRKVLDGIFCSIHDTWYISHSCGHILSVRVGNTGGKRRMRKIWSGHDFILLSTFATIFRVWAMNTNSRANAKLAGGYLCIYMANGSIRYTWDKKSALR